MRREKLKVRTIWDYFILHPNLVKLSYFKFQRNLQFFASQRKRNFKFGKRIILRFICVAKIPRINQFKFENHVQLKQNFISNLFFCRNPNWWKRRTGLERVLTIVSVICTLALIVLVASLLSVILNDKFKKGICQNSWKFNRKIQTDQYLQKTLKLLPKHSNRRE